MTIFRIGNKKINAIESFQLSYFSNFTDSSFFSISSVSSFATSDWSDSSPSESDSEDTIPPTFASSPSSSDTVTSSPEEIDYNFAILWKNSNRVLLLQKDLRLHLRVVFVGPTLYSISNFVLTISIIL